MSTSDLKRRQTHGAVGALVDACPRRQTSWLRITLGSLLGVTASAAQNFPTTLPVSGTTSLAAYGNCSEHLYTGTIPTQLGLLVNAEEIQFGPGACTSFTGSTPTELGQLSAVAELTLLDNSISGPIPSELGKLTAIAFDLSFSLNSFSGSLPSELGQLTSLAFSADFSVNSISGALPTELGSLSGIIFSLYVENNWITGSLPTELGQLTAMLYGIMAFDNVFSGAIPSELGRLTNLEGAYFDGNLIKSIPTEFGRCKAMEKSISLGDNFIVSIPTELGELSRIAHGMYMDNNVILSSIPTELGKLKGITESMYLGTNYIDGAIPTELGEITDGAGAMFLGTNLISGTIPTELGEVVRASAIDLSTNSIPGTIPTELGSLKGLEALNLQRNAITGSVPSELGGLKGLIETLDMDYNQLCGDVPTELQALAFGYQVGFEGGSSIGEACPWSPTSAPVHPTSGANIPLLWLAAGLALLPLAAVLINARVCRRMLRSTDVTADGTSTTSDTCSTSATSSPLLGDDSVEIELGDSVAHRVPSPDSEQCRLLRHVLNLGHKWRSSHRQLMVLDHELRVVLWSRGMAAATKGWKPADGISAEDFPFASDEDKDRTVLALQSVLEEEGADTDPLYALEAAANTNANVPLHLIPLATGTARWVGLQPRVVLGMAAVKMRPFSLGLLAGEKESEHQRSCHLLILGQEQVNPELVSRDGGVGGSGSQDDTSSISDLLQDH